MTPTNKIQPTQRLNFITAILMDGRLLPIARCIGGILLSHRNGETGLIFPSHQTIAAEAACSVDTVKRSIRALVKAGWFTVIHQARDGKKTVNRYVPGWEQIGRQRAPESASMHGLEGAPVHGGGCIGALAEGASMHGERVHRCTIEPGELNPVNKNPVNNNSGDDFVVSLPERKSDHGSKEIQSAGSNISGTTGGKEHVSTGGKTSNTFMAAKPLGRETGSSAPAADRPALGGVTEAEWRYRARGWKKAVYWQDDWGPRPGEDGCGLSEAVLLEVLAEIDAEEFTAALRKQREAENDVARREKAKVYLMERQKAQADAFFAGAAASVAKYADDEDIEF